MIPGNCSTSKYHNPEATQPPGYDTRKFSDQTKGKLLWFVSQSLKNNLHFQPLWVIIRRLCNLRVTIPRGCATSGYCKPEVAQALVMISGGCTTSGYRNLEIHLKKPSFVNIYAKTKYFSKIFWVVPLGPIYSWKKPDHENLMLLSL